MKTDAELNSETFSGSGDIEGQTKVSEPSIVKPPELEAAAEAGSGTAAPAEGARNEGQAKAAMAQQVEPSVEAEKTSSAGEADRDKRAEVSSAAIASSDAAPVNPLGDALAALDRKDYATAKQLFEALGRKDAAESIDTALAALDRKDYATAQGLFEALAPCKPGASGAPAASASRGKAQQKPAISPREVIPFAIAADRRAPPAEKAKKRRLKPLLLGTGLALFAVFAASTIYGQRLSWTLGVTKKQAAADLASAADLVKANWEAITGSKAREEQRAAMRDLGATLTQVTIRLDHIEQDYGERFDNSFSRFADIAARLELTGKESRSPGARFRIHRCRGQGRSVGEESRHRGGARLRICRCRCEARPIGKEGRHRDG